jgi:hypothetical protein
MTATSGLSWIRTVPAVPCTDVSALSENQDRVDPSRRTADIASSVAGKRFLLIQSLLSAGAIKKRIPQGTRILSVNYLIFREALPNPGCGILSIYLHGLQGGSV